MALNMASFSENDFFLMGEAIKEARLAALSGEVPAGALIVDENGSIVSRGHNKVIALNDPSAHAEIMALRTAAALLSNYRLKGLRLYSTLEPCAMCLMAAVHARVESIVFGAAEPKWGAAGSRLNLLAYRFNHSINISGGLRAEECAKQISDFFRAKRKAAKKNC